MFFVIVDKIENFGTYLDLHKTFMRVFDFLKSNDLNKLACGHHIIDGDNLFVNIDAYTTQSVQRLEAHRRYIDIQMVLQGVEKMGYAHIGYTNPKSTYDEAKDIVFLDGNTDTLTVDATMFLIFYPQDAHMPALNVGNHPQQVKKAVFKVKIT
ncbi:MAG: YhcH/YjgK/YiaL family protein [Puniceicoccales bacterium]|jgi:YhcH/YjgK/YiaL family protein|nr:YhcH/YjgK/YiaL family protein [Puniceicoccales bacterium]